MRFPHWKWLFVPTIAFYVGAALNILAITANRGVMPVHCPQQFWEAWASQGMNILPGYTIDEIHSVMKASDHLKFLCDWIVLPRVGIASPGDFFIWAGDYLQIPGLVAYIALVLKDERS